MKRLLSLLTAAAIIFPHTLFAADLVAESQVVSSKREQRLGSFNANANINLFRGASWNVHLGWENFFNTEFKEVLKAGFKIHMFSDPFGQRSYLAGNGDEIIDNPRDSGRGAGREFTQYSDAKLEVPKMVETFGRWKDFIDSHPDHRVIMDIGAPRVDKDFATYLMGVTQAQLPGRVRVHPGGLGPVYDLVSYASDPAKLDTIWEALVWPNILPILEVGVRDIILDASSAYVEENSITFQLAEKLMKPEKRHPKWDKSLIEAIGNKKVNAFIEGRPEVTPSGQWRGFPSEMASEHYYRSNPAIYPDRAGIKTRDSELGEILEVCETEGYWPIATEFEFSQKGVRGGRLTLVKPYTVYDPAQNKYGISNVEGFFRALGINFIDTHIKLEAKGAGRDDLEYIIVSAPKHGTVTQDAFHPWYVTYRNNQNYWGPDSFKFKVRAEDGTESNWATVYINPANAASPSDPGDAATSGKVGLFRNVLGSAHGDDITIPVVLEKSMEVQMDIHTRGGDLVKNLVKKEFPAGEFSFPWDGKNEANQKVASGTYLVKIKMGEKVVTKKVVVVR